MVLSADKSLPTRWIQVLAGLGFCILALGLFFHARSADSVRVELGRMQQRNGLRLASVQSNKIYTVDLANHSHHEMKRFVSKGTARFGSVSADGAEVAFEYCSDPGITHPTPYREECPAGFIHFGTARADGSGFQEYPYLRYPSWICWSHDKSKLALAVNNSLSILTLDSTAMREVADLNNFTTSQCWSPDDAELVYTENKPVGIQTVMLFDTKTGKSRTLTSGTLASWSPNGVWIAFLGHDDAYDRGDRYYVIHPDGTGKKLLFKTTVGVSELWWSPDSRFVAYVSARGVFERWPIPQFEDFEKRLRVRQLEDGAEDWFLNLSSTDNYRFQWVQNSFQ